VFIALVFAGGLLVGAAVGRWWALGLAVLVPIGFIPAGDDSDGSPEWITALLVFTPFALIGLALGVGFRAASRGRRG
jgi:hypothetical protein